MGERYTISEMVDATNEEYKRATGLFAARLDRLEGAVRDLAVGASEDYSPGPVKNSGIAALRSLDGDVSGMRYDNETQRAVPVAPAPPPEPPWIERLAEAEAAFAPEMPPLPRWHREASTEELLNWQRDSVEAATAGLRADREEMHKACTHWRERADTADETIGKLRQYRDFETDRADKAEARIADLERRETEHETFWLEKHAKGIAAERERVLREVREEATRTAPTLVGWLSAKLRGEG